MDETGIRVQHALVVDHETVQAFTESQKAQLELFLLRAKARDSRRKYASSLKGRQSQKMRNQRRRLKKEFGMDVSKDVSDVDDSSLEGQQEIAVWQSYNQWLGLMNKEKEAKEQLHYDVHQLQRMQRKRKLNDDFTDSQKKKTKLIEPTPAQVLSCVFMTPDSPDSPDEDITLECNCGSLSCTDRSPSQRISDLFGSVKVKK